MVIAARVSELGGKISRQTPEPNLYVSRSLNPFSLPGGTSEAKIS